MMNTIIVYDSKYGATERYARELATRLQIDAVSIKNAKGLKDYKRIILMGGVYIGRVRHLSKMLNKVSKDAEIVIIGVGLAEPNSELAKKEFDASNEKVMSNRPYTSYLLRGAIDYSRLQKFDYMGMKMMYNMMSKKPKEELGEGGQMILDTFGKQVDYIDFDTLAPIVSAIKNN